MITNWNLSFGPANLRMPIDPNPVPQTDWTSIPPTHGKIIHEDEDDSLNPDGSWGPDDVGEVGGTGVSLGYSFDDLAAVRVAAAAVLKRKKFYDWGHYHRQFRYAEAAWEMTRERTYASQLVMYADGAKFGYTNPDGTKVAGWSETGPISYGQGWTPENFAQYLDMAKKGLPMPGSMGREAAWACYAELLGLKVNPRRSPSMLKAFYDTCNISALPSGQIVHDEHAGIGQTNVEYAFHASLRNIVYLMVCYRLGLEIKPWLFQWANNIYDAPVLDYGGSPAPPAFYHTVGTELIPATGPAQDGDPAHAWWSSFCVVLAKVSGQRAWIRRATKFGPTDAKTQQSLKESMLLRGWRGQ